MHILLVADGRSSHTRSWIKSLVALGHEITLISSYPCAPVQGVQADLCMPVAFAALGGSASSVRENLTKSPRRAGKNVISSFRSLFLAARYRLGPLTLAYYGPRFRGLASRLQPDLVHALRIPFEGMLASFTPPEIPLAVSIWGNDLTLHAPASGGMASFTRRTLTRANALLADTQRDMRIAKGWGFDPLKPSLVVPGNGGVDLALMESVRIRYAEGGLPASSGLLEALHLPAGTPLVVNPRGFRTGSVRQDTFFEAVPLILKRRPEIQFACPAMAGQVEAQRLVDHLGIQENIRLLPHLPQEDLWSLFLRAGVTVSVSQHDGTPNSLLEAFALGCFPVAGDIESIREWITPGVNGLLVEPDKPQDLAEAILLALDHPELRRCAAKRNTRLVAERAGAGVVREKIEGLYQSLKVNV